MKILVTGAASSIGTNLCNELVKGHKVMELIYSILRGKTRRCDVKHYRQLEKIFDDFGKFDYVYHLQLSMADGMVRLIMKIFG